MVKRAFLISFLVVLMISPLAAMAADIPAKVFENGTNDDPVAISQVKVEVFGGYGFKGLLSSTESDSNGECVLKNVPLGKDVLVRLIKAGFVTQYDIRSYSNTDADDGVIFWTGSEGNLNGLYNQLGESFDTKKGHVYLDISDETTGEGVEGVQLAVSAGKVYDFGDGDYLIANAEGTSLKIGIQKPGYAFDIESAAIPLFAGGMTQYYIKVQSGGAVYASARAPKVTIAGISGFIKTVSKGDPVSGVSVAFTRRNQTVRPTVTTDSTGFYSQDGFPVRKLVKVTPSLSPWKFRPKSRLVFVRPQGSKANFKAK